MSNQLWKRIEEISYLTCKITLMIVVVKKEKNEGYVSHDLEENTDYRPASKGPRVVLD